MSAETVSLDYTEHVYHRDFVAGGPSEPAALWRIGDTDGAILMLDLFGHVGADPFTIRHTRVWSVDETGAVTLDPIGTDVATGAGAASVAVEWDTATYPGEVQIRVAPTTDVEIEGRAKIQADGMVSAVRRGEPTDNLV